MAKSLEWFSFHVQVWILGWWQCMLSLFYPPIFWASILTNSHVRPVHEDLCHSTVEAGPGATCVTQRDFPENLDGRHWAGSLLLSWVWSFRIFERPDTAESFLRNLLLSNLISPGLSIRCTWIRKHIPFSGMVFAIFRYSPINLNGANGVSFHYYINGYHHKTKSGVLGTTSKLRNWMRFFYELVSHIYCHSNFSTLW